MEQIQKEEEKKETSLSKLLKEMMGGEEGEENVCQISGLPLTEHAITLECNHAFNYSALFHEIYSQKYRHNSYQVSLLSHAAKKKFMHSGFNYFIQCPYCRDIQFTLLPYVESLELPKIYGINTLETKAENNPLLIMSHVFQKPMVPFYVKRKICFNWIANSQCGEILNAFGDVCVGNFLATIPGTNECKCFHHYFKQVKKLAIKAKEEAITIKTQAKKSKEEAKTQAKEAKKEAKEAKIQATKAKKEAKAIKEAKEKAKEAMKEAQKAIKEAKVVQEKIETVSV